MTIRAVGVWLSLLVTVTGCGQADQGSQGFEPVLSVEDEALVANGALLVVGSTTLVAGDTAIRNRLQTLGFTVTVRSGTAVTAADAAGKVVVISESVTSADVNTKLKNVAAPLVSFEPSLFDDLGFVDPSNAANYGAEAGQTGVALQAASSAPLGNVSVTLTTSAQSFAWAKPVASATRLATLVGDNSRVTIFSFDSGSALFGSTAPARRAGWFATAAAPTAFNANAWSLFDGLMRWAKQGMPADACAADVDCSGGQRCVAGRCATVCPAGQTACSGSCVDLSSSFTDCGACGNSCGARQACVSGVCSCRAGSTMCSGSCTTLEFDGLNCGACGNVCATGKSCQSGICL